ncbi:6337_t:CDS:2, partial [Funneliformis geosporum]
SFILFCYNEVFSIEVIARTQIDFSNDLPKIMEVYLTDDSPKNVMIGSFFSDRYHIQPILDICIILVERGYNAILVSPDSIIPSLEYPTIKHIPLGLKIDINKFNHQKYKDIFNIYENIVVEYNIDLIWCDVVMINGACLDVANFFNKPLIGYGSFPLGFTPVGIKPKHDLNARSKDLYELELSQYLPPSILEIGSSFPDKYSSLTRELSSFINSHNQVLCVNLGTQIFKPSNYDFILQSFIEAMKNNFINGLNWSLSKASIDDFSAIFNLVDDATIQNFSTLNNEYPNISFTSKFTISNYTNTKLFLSNGGTESSYESLYTATPMLLMPTCDEGMRNTEKINIAGIGVEDILERIKFMLNDEQVKKNDRRIEYLTKITSKRKYITADLIEYILHTSGESNRGKILKESNTADFRIGFYATYGNFILAFGLTCI